MRYHSFSSRGTKFFGEKFAKRAIGKKQSAFTKATAGRQASSAGALILALTGELGSGKTTFVQGFFRGLGIKKSPISPTFIIMRRTAIRRKTSASRAGFQNVYHIDAYRIKHPRELAPLGLKEIMNDSKNIVLIEWAENIKKILPRRGVTWIIFKHYRKETDRLMNVLSF